jgi:hypothetical protein
MEMEIKKLIGKKVKILAISDSAIIVSYKNKKYVIYSYCACNSGFWYLNIQQINKKNFNRFSNSIEELYQSLKQ